MTGRGSEKPKLLSGGNPQIAKGDGDGPVQNYISAMPDWKQSVGRELDALIVELVPDVIKADRSNSPSYGVERENWFLNFHCVTKYEKVAFFQGASLVPEPPITSNSGEVRYVHLFGDDEFDREKLASWTMQAAMLPGWSP